MTLRGIAARAAALSALVVAAACDRSEQSTPQLSPQAVKLLNEGAGAMGQFEFAQARGVFDALLASEPSNPYARLNQAIAMMNETTDGSQARAITALEPLSDDPTVGVRAIYCTALAHLFLGRADLALPLFQRVAAEVSDDAHAAYFTGQCLEQVDASSDALAQYERAAALDPYLRSAVLGGQRCYGRAGDSEKSAELLALFDRLANNPRSTLAEFKYTRMGPLAEVFVPSQPVERPAPAGALFAPPSAMNIERLPTSTGSVGLHSTIDLNADGSTDLMWAVVNAQGAGSLMPMMAVPANDGAAMKWAAMPDHPLASIPASARLMWGDLNNDGRVDAVVRNEAMLVWYEQQAGGAWSERSFGDAALTQLFQLAVADLDHDGDLDLVASGRNGQGVYALWAIYNRLDGSWHGVEIAHSEPLTRSVVVIDVDRDGDLDLIAIGAAEHSPYARVYINDRLWAWSVDSARYGAFEAAPMHWAVGFLRDADGTPMLATLAYSKGFLTGPRTDLEVWAFDHTGPQKISSVDPGHPDSIAVADVQGNGEKCILLAGRNLNGSVLFSGDSSFSAAVYSARGKFQCTIDGSFGGTTSPPVPALLNGVGIVLFHEGFQVQWPGEGRAPVATIALRGRIDPAQQMRTNASGIGASMAARVGTRWVATAQLPWNTSSGQSTDPCVIGLGTDPQVDFLSIDWPDGVTQSERTVGAGAHTIVETQRQISSCPVVFAWDGTEMRFITDSLGVGGIGYLASVTKDDAGRIAPIYAPPRPWERIAIPADALAARAGRYEIALSEPMEEFTALDAASLTTFDLPPGWNIAFDERMGISDPQPTGAAIFWREAMAPARATVTHGTREAIDQTEAACARDLHAVDPGEIDSRFIGRTAEPFAVELVFPRALTDGEGDPVLLMDGWIEYPYCSTNFAMWQAHASPTAPTFDALDPVTGAWVTLVREYGYPAGMPREAAFPLARSLLPPGCTTLRITTNQELYIDRCRIVWSEPCPQAIERRVAIAFARVRESGYAKRIPAPQRRPIYDYDARVPLFDCRTQPGWYTATDVDCAPLVEAIDDAVAIFAAGEELRLTFDSAAPPLEHGWSRAFVLDLNGWCKDMDPLTRDGARVDPLPMRDSESSPSPARDALHREFNTRYRGGR